MRVRSTVLLAAAAGVPVALAVAQSPRAEMATAHSGAVTWATIPEPTSSNSRHLVALDVRADGHGITAEAHTAVRITADGGRTWEIVAAPAGEITAAAAGAGGIDLVGTAAGAIYRSADEGRNWTLVRASGRSVNRVRFTTATTAFATGFQLLLRSRDAGLTWEALEPPAQDWYDIAFATHNVALLVGGGGTIARSSDGGVSWQQIEGGDQQLYSVAVISRNAAVAVGAGGTILRSSDQGASWRPLSGGTRQDLRSVTFVDSLNGVVAGMFGTVLSSSDGGRSWHLENAGTNAHLLAAAAPAGRHPLIVGSRGTFIVRATLLTEPARRD